MLKRRGNDRFHVVLTWNTRGKFAGIPLMQSFSSKGYEGTDQGCFADNFVKVFSTTIP